MTRIREEEEDRWNELPAAVRMEDNSAHFKQLLKPICLIGLRRKVTFFVLCAIHKINNLIYLGLIDHPVGLDRLVLA